VHVAVRPGICCASATIDTDSAANTHCAPVGSGFSRHRRRRRQRNKCTWREERDHQRPLSRGLECFRTLALMRPLRCRLSRQ
jgi:hypothetical protein